MSSSQSKRKRITSSTSNSTRLESRDLLRSQASENSPDKDHDFEDLEGLEAANIIDLDEVEGARDEEEDEASSKKLRKRGLFWEHFEPFFCKQKNKKRARCIHCKSDFAADPVKNGTGTLSRHWKTCRHNPANESKGTQSKLVLEKIDEDGQFKIKNWVLDLEEVRKNLSRMKIGEELPFMFVEKSFFKNLCASMCPTFKVPSRSTITRDCYQLYKEEIVKLKDFIKKNCQRVCLTTDSWTSIQRVNYMTLTAHFVDDDWKLQKRILNFFPISGHKGEDIARDVEDCLRFWDLGDKIFTMTMDNASANDTACDKLKDMVKANGSSINKGKNLHMRCTAHIVNLIVNSGLKRHVACIDKVRLVVKFIRNSPSRLRMFKEEVQRLKIECKRSLVFDVPTRWNSTYMMLDVALKYKNVFPRLDTPRDDNGEYLGHISIEEWVEIEVIVNFLKEFYDFTNIVSGSSYVTVSNVFLYIGQILSLLNQWVKSTDPICQSMAVQMKKKCDKYWDDVKTMNVFIFVGIILDPRYKFEGLKLALNDLYGENKGEELATYLKDYAKEIFDEYKNIYAPSSSENQNPATSGSRSTGTSFGSAPPTPSFLRNLASKLNELDESDGAMFTNEFDRYFHELRSQDSDVLAWWKLNGHRFPILARMARDVLAVPVTTVPSESAFSTGGRTLDHFRSSLSPKMVEALICTQDWMRAIQRSREFVCDEIELLDESDKVVEDME